MAKSDHLWQRGGQWYFRLAIPRSLRRHFLSKTGKPLVRIVEPLGDSKSQAQIAAARRAAAYLEVFARLKTGERMTPDEIKAEVSLDLAAVAEYMRRVVRGEEPDPSPMPEMPADYQQWVASSNESEPEPPEEDSYDVDLVCKRFGITPPKSGTKLFQAIAELAWQSKQVVIAELTGSPPPVVPQAERPAVPLPAPQAAPISETVGQAALAWFDDMQRDPSAAVKATTLDGHRLRVGAFVKHYGNVLLSDVTRAMASDFLSNIAAGGLSNRTVNNYQTTLACVFESAKQRGRFIGESPFNGKKRKAVGESYVPFEVAELQTVFDALPRDVKPTKHTPETALPWVALIAAYTGMRLEEIAQLTTSDIHDQGANGATVTVIDIHNGGNNALKNAASARLVPIHSALYHADLLKYRDALPAGGPLFPGLVRRASKGGKVGARLGELFRDNLEALNLKRDRLCFHSFRHTVAHRLEAAGVSTTDAARVLGHTVPGMTYGVYSKGPGLKRLADVVERIEYPGLRCSVLTSVAGKFTFL